MQGAVSNDAERTYARLRHWIRGLNRAFMENNEGKCQIWSERLLFPGGLRREWHVV